MTDSTESKKKGADKPGVEFGRWRLVRFDSLNLALYKRNESGKFATSGVYFQSPGDALRYAANADAVDAIPAASDVEGLQASWRELAKVVDKAAVSLSKVGR